MSEKVTCNVCGKVLNGKVPKGGDGSILYPRKHLIPAYNDSNYRWSGERATCKGSYLPAKEFVELT